MRRESPGRLRPEHELILACAHTNLPPGAEEKIRRLVQGELDWLILMSTAVDQQVAPLLYTHLNNLTPQIIPHDWMEFLRLFCENSARHSLYLSCELLRILEVFGANGIQLIPFKGSVLALLAYGNLALRSFSDLDFFLCQAEIPKARQLLQTEGFQERYADLRGRGPHARGQYAFRGDGGLCLVELHTEETLRYFPRKLDIAELRTRLIQVPLGGRTAPSLPVEDLLVLLCVHGTKHFWDRLLWLCDIAELVQRVDEVTLQRAEARAREIRCERMFHLGLLLVRDLLEAPLPEELARRVDSDAAARWMAERVVQQVFREAGGPSGVLQRTLFRGRAVNGQAAGLRYCLRLALRPAERDGGPSRGPEFLESFLRPFRLFRRYGLGTRPLPLPDLAPFVPTPPEVVERILEFGEVGPGDVLYDLGCGDGRIVARAAERFGIRCVGVDQDPERVREAKANVRRHGVEHLVQIVQQDAKTVDVSGATVVTLYLTLLGNAKLQRELKEQLRAGSRVVSRDYLMPGWPPELSQLVELQNSVRTVLHRWRIPSP